MQMNPRAVMNSHEPQHLAESSAAEFAAADVLLALRERLNDTLRGKADVVEMVLACLLARGHLLIEDLPGLGKTTLAKALALAVGGEFARVQCTPDLLPADVTGFNVFNQQTREFEFQRGPVFSHVLLADEINRATPRTQSALFEAMSERQVTIDNVTRALPETFFVIATQNPVESHGAYPLPEAQLDRFSMKLHIGYPDAASEREMLAADVGALARPKSASEPLLQPEVLTALQQDVSQVGVSEVVQDYLIALAGATRRNANVRLGLSPRGLLTWQRVSQAWAYLQGRRFVTPTDIQQVAPAVLGVRLQGSLQQGVALAVEEILHSIDVPTSVK